MWKKKKGKPNSGRSRCTQTSNCIDMRPSLCLTFLFAVLLLLQLESGIEPATALAPALAPVLAPALAAGAGLAGQAKNRANGKRRTADSQTNSSKGILHTYWQRQRMIQRFLMLPPQLNWRTGKKARDLCFAAHVNAICASAWKMLGKIWKNISPTPSNSAGCGHVVAGNSAIGFFLFVLSLQS